MLLTDAHIESIRQMVGSKTRATIVTLCEELNVAEQEAMISDTAEWELVKNKNHVRMAGGSKGVDLNFERKQRDLRNRVLDRLGLPRLLSGGGLYRIPVGANYDGSCDQFGNA